MKFLKSLIFLFILNVFKNPLKNFRNVKPLGREGVSSLIGNIWAVIGNIWAVKKTFGQL